MGSVHHKRVLLFFGIKYDDPTRKGGIQTNGRRQDGVRIIYLITR